MRTMHKEKKVVFFLMMVLGVGIFAITGKFAFANNYTDTTFEFTYSGDGSDVATTARNKTDNTYTYVRSLEDSEGTLNVAAAAKSGITSGEQGDPFSYGYVTDWYQIKASNRKYFPNDAHKKGYSATYLCMSSSDHKSHYYHGKWSPDNCSGYGSAN
ncbi:MAG: hypothetical protein PUC12_12315 [Clostridiales bacterium]|nr:hypothetical protein [Clostridiales bacterium]